MFMPHRLGFSFLLFSTFSFFFYFVIHLSCFETRLQLQFMRERKEMGFTKKGAMDWLAEEGKPSTKGRKTPKKKMNV
jgi:hypothetical protein